MTGDFVILFQPIFIKIHNLRLTNFLIERGISEVFLNQIILAFKLNFNIFAFMKSN
jgi:hypothetical protein